MTRDSPWDDEPAPLPASGMQALATLVGDGAFTGSASARFHAIFFRPRNPRDYHAASRARRGVALIHSLFTMIHYPAGLRRAKLSTMRWITLLAMGVLTACAEDTPKAPALAEPGHQVFLNHMYTVLDQETFTALGSEPFMSDLFAATVTRTVEADGESWTGLYVWGEVSYLEFFPPSIVDEVGDSGVAFGVETPGALERLAERARATGIEVETDERLADVDGELIPWFRWAAAKRSSEVIEIDDWVMEYQPEYMAYIQDPAPAVPGDISRRTYLSDLVRPEQLMRHVSRVRFAMPRAEREAFARSALAYEWTVRRDGEAIIAEGPEATSIEVVADDTKRGLLELTIELTRKPEVYRELQLGNSTLMIGPDEWAVWRFDI
jgi:hypothetical protein